MREKDGQVWGDEREFQSPNNVNPLGAAVKEALKSQIGFGEVISLMPIALSVISLFSDIPKALSLAATIIAFSWFFLLQLMRLLGEGEKTPVIGAGIVWTVVLMLGGWNLSMKPLEPFANPVPQLAPTTVPEADNLKTAPMGPPANERVFIPPDIDYSDLTGFYKNRTTMQADQLASNYIGKWMSLKTKVRDVQKNDLSEGYTIFAGLDESLPIQVAMYFNDDWATRVTMLKVGSPIALIGKLSSIQERSIYRLVIANWILGKL